MKPFFAIVFLSLASLTIAQQPAVRPSTLSPLGQTDSPVVGTVTAKDGKPISGVSVSGGLSGSCCPQKREQVTTDQNGQFRIEHPGAVLRFSTENFEPAAFVVSSEKSPIHITLKPSTDNLVVPVCGKVKAGQQRIGWGKYGLHFDVAQRSLKILGGKPDVDYVLYVIRPKTGEAALELWFGPMAFSMMPSDDELIRSETFEQRNIVKEDGRWTGVDSWGQQGDGTRWRHTAVVAEGAKYKDVSPEQARLFDEIVNSLCEVSDPNQ